MSEQDLQGLVQRARREAEKRGVNMSFVLFQCADALERLSKARGTCSSCRFLLVAPLHSVNPICLNPKSQMFNLAMQRAAVDVWGCTSREPQPTAIEEASK